MKCHYSKGQPWSSRLTVESQGILGFHFTHYQDDDTYQAQLEKVSKYLVSKGVTAFWCTIPTVSVEEWKKVLIPLLIFLYLLSFCSNMKAIIRPQHLQIRYNVPVLSVKSH